VERNIRDAAERVSAAIKIMLDKILFWVVLVWMVALLVMAIMAVRDVWKEDSHEPTEPDGCLPDPNSRPTTDRPGAGQAADSGTDKNAL